jgi:hypothetical protein
MPIDCSCLFNPCKSSTTVTSPKQTNTGASSGKQSTAGTINVAPAAQSNRNPSLGQPAPPAAPISASHSKATVARIVSAAPLTAAATVTTTNTSAAVPATSKVTVDRPGLLPISNTHSLITTPQSTTRTDFSTVTPASLTSGSTGSLTSSVPASRHQYLSSIPTTARSINSSELPQYGSPSFHNPVRVSTRSDSAKGTGTSTPGVATIVTKPASIFSFGRNSPSHSPLVGQTQAKQAGDQFVNGTATSTELPLTRKKTLAPLSPLPNRSPTPAAAPSLGITTTDFQPSAAQRPITPMLAAKLSVSLNEISGTVPSDETIFTVQSPIPPGRFHLRQDGVLLIRDADTMTPLQTARPSTDASPNLRYAAAQSQASEAGVSIVPQLTAVQRRLSHSPHAEPVHSARNSTLIIARPRINNSPLTNNSPLNSGNNANSVIHTSPGGSKMPVKTVPMPVLTLGPPAFH